MRITGGIYKGRKLIAPAGVDTRPTSDRVREALFNILLHRDWGDNINHSIRDKKVLDVFAGTGALGLEALSHGADHVAFIEKGREALKALRQNIQTLKCDNQTTLLARDATGPLTTENAYDLIFLDPPYKKELVPKALASLEAQNLIAEHALIIIETAKKEALELPDLYTPHLSRSYGDTMLHFFKKA